MKQPDISVVVPVFNSEEIVSSLVQRICLALNGRLSYEILLVNDGSHDASWNTIKEEAQQNTLVTGINLRRNYGQDNAILAGIRAATGSYVAIMDDDLQHAPEDIMALYEKCRQGYDVCYGNFTSKRQSIVKNIGSGINGFFAWLLLSKPRHIYLSPFKVINRATANEVGAYNGSFPYIDGILLSVTNNITQTELMHHKRAAGRSNYNLYRSVLVFLKMATGFSARPLRMATIAGAVASFSGVALLSYYLYQYYLHKSYMDGWMTIVALIILFSGLILLSLGIIGEYVGRIYISLNRQGQYSIEDVIKKAGA